MSIAHTEKRRQRREAYLKSRAGLNVHGIPYSLIDALPPTRTVEAAGRHGFEVGYIPLLRGAADGKPGAAGLVRLMAIVINTRPLYGGSSSELPDLQWHDKHDR